MPALLACLLFLFCSLAFAVESAKPLELSRPVRPWEFISALGTRAAIFGHEQGTLETWAYPLKILTDFHLLFHVDGVVIPAETLARTLIVHPESTTIVYAGDDFSVRETLFVPVHEPGAVIAFEIETRSPLEVEAVFRRDFQLEWPGHIGDSMAEWDPALHAFHFADDTGKFEAFVGSASATKNAEEYATNYFSSSEDSLLLGPVNKGRETKLVAIAASFTGRPEAVRLYRRLLNDYPALLQESASYYSDYLSRTVGVHLPDAQLESAYDWARVSMLQGVVQNPFLGEGLVAGFNTAQNDFRPGFAWFFGRDAEWTSFALNAEGDFAHVRTALEFLGKYQRADGKIPHEISQSTGLMDWFKMPFAYASVDATPLFIIAIGDYVTESGDVEFAREKWDSLWKAYTFLQSTYDAQGFAQNATFGHGWIEGGPLRPLQTELYQAGLGVEAVRALSNLARVIGKQDVANELSAIFDRQRSLLDKAFWSPDKQAYAYALDSNNNRIDTPSVLAAVPMWFRLLNEDHTQAMIGELARPTHQTDWGMRIISSQNPKYDPGGYHFGTVWPLFTGWASVAEYRYHRSLPAYSNLRANALLALDGSLGHVTEVLSGDYYQTLSTGSPHQIWSAAMVVSPLLRGLMGLETDAIDCRLTFAPHIPADWNEFSIDHLRLGDDSVNVHYRRIPDRIILEISSAGAKPGARQCVVNFSPALSPRARVRQVRLNGRSVPFNLAAGITDQHVTITIPISTAKSELEIGVDNNFDLSWEPTLPALGSTSHGLRAVSESWSASRDKLTLVLSGKPGEKYELSAWDSRQLSSVDGAQLEKTGERTAKVWVKLPAASSGADPQDTIVFHFAAKRR